MTIVTPIQEETIFNYQNLDFSLFAAFIIFQVITIAAPIKKNKNAKYETHIIYPIDNAYLLTKYIN